MDIEGRTCSYLSGMNFETTLRLVRREMERGGLRVVCEVDTCESLKRALGVHLGRGAILFVDHPALALEAMVMSRVSALFIPEPVVVSEREEQARILLRSDAFLSWAKLPQAAAQPLLQIHSRIARAVEEIAEREVMLAGVF